MVCGLFTILTFYPSTPSTPPVRADVLIHPREVQALWSQHYTTTRELQRKGVDNATPRHRTVLDTTGTAYTHASNPDTLKEGKNERRERKERKGKRKKTKETGQKRNNTRSKN